MEYWLLPAYFRHKIRLSIYSVVVISIICMPIRDIARTDVVTASEGDSIEDLAHLMMDEGVGSVVITDGDEPVGIVTDRDLSIRVLAQAEGIDLASPFSIEDLRVERIMTYGPFTADVNDSLLDVMDKMCQKSCRRIPITEEGELYGIVTLDDLLLLISGEINDLAKVVADESPEFEEDMSELLAD